MAEVEYVAHVIVMPIVLSIGRPIVVYLPSFKVELSGMINQCMNIFTLLHLHSSGFLYLKASAAADILSIISFIPFLLRHAGKLYLLQ